MMALLDCSRRFVATGDRAGVDARGNLLFQRASDGEELVFDEEVIELVREGGDVEIRRHHAPQLPHS